VLTAKQFIVAMFALFIIGVVLGSLISGGNTYAPIPITDASTSQ
jgi:fucose permease